MLLVAMKGVLLMQGIIDEAAVDGFFAECIARRLSPDTGGAAAAVKFVRRPASAKVGASASSTEDASVRKKPIPHSPYSAEGPPPPVYSPYPSPVSKNYHFSGKYTKLRNG